MTEVENEHALPSKAQAKALSEYFKVAPELFLSYEP